MQAIKLLYIVGGFFIVYPPVVLILWGFLDALRQTYKKCTNKYLRSA